MKDPTSQLRTATRRAKSDVANKLISMFLHDLSKLVAQNWQLRVDGEEYESLVRQSFANQCPYCSRDLTAAEVVIEHLDGMNRIRAGLHVPGNVLVACRKCNSEKRRDDALKVLLLAGSGWESFLSHDGTRCSASCQTCQYWSTVFPDGGVRKKKMNDNLLKIRVFRSRFTEYQAILPILMETLPALLTKLYSDCQIFAETEIKALLERFKETSAAQL